MYENQTIIQQPVNLKTLNDRMTNAALDFIEYNSNSGNPFFLYLPFFHSHWPPYSANRFVNTSIRGYYGDSMTEMDWTVGQVLSKLKDLGIDGNTLVFFTSDNGPDLPHKLNAGSAGLLRCGKGTAYEGEWCTHLI